MIAKEKKTTIQRGVRVRTVQEHHQSIRQGARLPGVRQRDRVRASTARLGLVVSSRPSRSGSRQLCLCLRSQGQQEDLDLIMDRLRATQSTLMTLRALPEHSNQPKEER